MPLYNATYSIFNIVSYTLHSTDARLAKTFWEVNLVALDECIIYAMFIHQDPTSPLLTLGGLKKKK